MAKTSIHIEPIKPSSEVHNRRLKVLDYVLSELTPTNESWEADTVANRRSSIEARYQKSMGRRMQKNATPIREGVVVIQPSTTMADLRGLCQKIEDRFGIRAFQIYIHRDEGFKNSKETKLNLHAHIVFDFTNDQGKNLRLGRVDMMQLQTLCAESLDMERGVSSDKEHLNAVQYKVKVCEEKIDDLLSEIESLQNKKNTKELYNKAVERFKDKLGITTNDKEKTRLQAEKTALEGKIEELTGKVDELKTERDKLSARNVYLDSQWKEMQRKYGVVSKNNDTLKNERTKLGNELRDIFSGMGEAALQNMLSNYPLVRELYELATEAVKIGRSLGR